MTTNPVPYRTEDDSKSDESVNNFLKIFAVVLVLVVLVCAFVAVWSGSEFLVLIARDLLKIPGADPSSIPIRVLAVFVVLALLGVVRYLVSYVTDFVRKIFRIGQFDVVTIVIACVVNGLIMWLNTWLSSVLIDGFKQSNVENFLSSGSPLAWWVVFGTLTGTMLWIPRLGMYGENKLGRFDSDDR